MNIVKLYIPRKLVRYPRLAIISLWIAVIFQMIVTEQPSLIGWILQISALWLILSIDDRQEQRKGFDICAKQIAYQLNYRIITLPDEVDIDKYVLEFQRDRLNLKERLKFDRFNESFYSKK